MMMGDQNVGQPPACLRKGLQDWLFVAGIDAGRGSCLGIMDKHPEMIGTHHKLSNFQAHSGLLRML